MNQYPVTKIKGSGIYLPEERVSNERLEELLGLERGYIESTTGIKERRWSSSHETCEYMAAESALNAVKNADVKKIDAMVIARDAILTQKAYSLTPHIKEKLENNRIDVNGCYSIDIVNYCTGFAHAMNIASLLVGSGQAKNVLVVSSTNYRDTIVEKIEFHKAMGKKFERNSPAISTFSIAEENTGFQSPALNSFLWGCGAGSIVVGEESYWGHNIRGASARSNTKFQENNFGFGETTDGRNFCVLDGPSIYKYAMSEIPLFINDFIRDNKSIHPDKIKLVPHQPNPRMLSRLAEKLDLVKENVMISSDYLGNMIGASVPITYHLAKEQGKIRLNDQVLFCSFGDSYLTASAFTFTESSR